MLCCEPLPLRLSASPKTLKSLCFFTKRRHKSPVSHRTTQPHFTLPPTHTKGRTHTLLFHVVDCQWLLCCGRLRLQGLRAKRKWWASYENRSQEQQGNIQETFGSDQTSSSAAHEPIPCRQLSLGSKAEQEVSVKRPRARCMHYSRVRTLRENNIFLLGRRHTCWFSACCVSIAANGTCRTEEDGMVDVTRTSCVCPEFQRV